MRIIPALRTGKMRSRSGAAMIFALIALLVASTMVAALLRTTALSHRQLKREEYRLQASLLVDAGYARATAALRQRSDFREERWLVPEDQLFPGRTATVQLAVAADPAEPSRQIVSVTAEYPLNHPDAVRITRRTLVR